jgi:hypothetical protein
MPQQNQMAVDRQPWCIKACVSAYCDIEWKTAALHGLHNLLSQHNLHNLHLLFAGSVKSVWPGVSTTVRTFCTGLKAGYINQEGKEVRST